MAIGFDVISYSGDLYVYLAALAQSVADVRQIAASGHDSEQPNFIPA